MNKLKSKRIIGIICAAALTGTMLSGCGGKENEDAVSPMREVI